MEVVPKQPSAKGPADWFTGDVWIDAIAKGEEPSRVRVNAVRFSPGARTAWHSHALGQTLYVTEGAGLAQSRDGDIVDIRSGDVVHTPTGEWHWHGAAPGHFMSHLSITEAVAEGPEMNGEPTSPTPSTVPTRREAMSAEDDGIRMGVDEARAKLEAGGAIALDVVQPGAWEQVDGAVEGAVRIPPAEIEQRFRELPLDLEVITYCT